ncbi:TetR/AcrR family transcriptional regulator [Vulgatibacter incomptus]|uniref:Putative transcriptional regulator for fatty acid degradation FadP, TetR family n=1 Tax=Vulgatibacter incomptus TaxID=1391653 RepID=A0A0K1PBF4_9BACT|nr:TetR/AcrR family transcriptional regulator [Vulgatibacter incomptus]AKU90855.1 putative transcriptional regulator for fatty acid degradation FadP, TetR family [Vulgatibacter incomptus]
MRKGDFTRQAILDHAVKSASKVGLDGLSIGVLATELGMSKSGLFAHFASKEALKVEVLERAAVMFYETVMLPALAAERGLPRIRAIFTRWMDWAEHAGLLGGCIFVAAAVELDDQPGAARETLVRTQADWLDALAKSAEIAMGVGHFRPELDPDQFAHELYATMLGLYHASRLMRDPRARERAVQSFEALVERASAH